MSLRTALPNASVAGRWVGQLGGFLGRTRDGEPGVTVLWRGLGQLAVLVALYALLTTPTSSANEQL